MFLQLNNLITPGAGGAVDIELQRDSQSTLIRRGNTYIISCRNATTGMLALHEPSGNSDEYQESPNTKQTLSADGYQIKFVAEYSNIKLVGSVTSGPYKIKITQVRN